MTPNDDEVFPQIGAQTFLPSFQLNSETLKTFCTRNHQLGLRLLSRGASSSASVHTLFLLYLQLLFVSLSLSLSLCCSSLKSDKAQLKQEAMHKTDVSPMK